MPATDGFRAGEAGEVTIALSRNRRAESVVNLKHPAALAVFGEDV